MAILLRSKTFLSSCLKSLPRFERCKQTLGERGFQAELYSEMAPAPNPALHPIDTSKWKKIQASKVGITGSMISLPSWIVLNTLRKEGFEAYLVGGCVRDLLLKRIPKDFDVITTANLKQIKKKFHRAEIVGRRFPICRVHIKGFVIEVSSFETVAKHDEDKAKALSSLIPNGCDEKDLIRWRNSMNRDFTINSLFFDPFTFKIYDYNSGMSDLKSLKLQTIIPAHLSFQEDCGSNFSYAARILRGLRIAARLGLSFSKDTESAMHNISSSIEGLDKFRLMLELNYMLSYGAAESSIYLLQRFNLLNILLPFQFYFLILLSFSFWQKLFFNLDKLVSCDHPADSSLWIGLLIFHLALVNNPQDALVVWTFASVLYHGKWKEGVEFSREHTKVGVKFVPEISGFSETKSDEDLAKEVSQFASLVQDSVCALTETSSLFESMSRYSFSPCSGLVFVPKKTARDAAKIFYLMVDDIESFVNGRQRESPGINYHLLGKGDPRETRYVLGKIILETMKDGRLGEGTQIANGEKDHLQPKVIEKNLANNQLPLKKDKKRVPSLLNPEAKQGLPKKQKSVDSNHNISELYAAIKNQLAKEELQDLAKKHQKLVEAYKFSEQETSLMQGNILEEEKSHLMNQERTVVKEDTHKDDGKKKAKKDMKISNKQRKVVGKYNLSQDTVVNWQKLYGNEGCKEEVKEKTGKHEPKAVKRKGSRTLLSSLFK
ncbi:Poly A polymerase [Theobroma cacao]|nr:Poly A polymerase [Theobroma cacao]